jgi:hypothetical protein
MRYLPKIGIIIGVAIVFFLSYALAETFVIAKILALVGMFAAIMLAGYALDSENNSFDTPEDSFAESIVVRFGYGLLVAILSWTASYYIFKNERFGSGVILVFALVGVAKIIKVQSIEKPNKYVVITLVSAFVLGCYHVLPILIPNFSGDSLYISGYCRRDMNLHLWSAAVIGECGLPPLSYRWYPSIEAPYTASHVGVFTLIAGLAKVTNISVHRLFQILMIVGYIILSLYGYGFAKLLRLSRRYSMLIGMLILVWGNFSLLFKVILQNWNGGVIPHIYSSIKPTFPSGWVYHNITQLYTVIVTASAVLLFARYYDKDRTRDLFGSICLMALTFTIKPSISILILPAMCIVFVARRERFVHWIGLITISVFGFAVYYLPHFLVDVSSVAHWLISFPADSLLLWMYRYFAWIGLAWIVFFYCILDLFRNWKNRRDYGTVELLVISGIGGILFSLLFRESGYRVGHGNHLWGLMSILVLLIPVTISYSINLYRKYNSKIIKSSIILLIFLHLFSGILYAFSYPSYEAYGLSKITISDCKNLRIETESDTKLVFDPDFLDNIFYMPILGRRAFVKDPTDRYDNWLMKVKRQDPEVVNIVTDFDAIVVGPNTRWLIPNLVEVGWYQKGRNYGEQGEFELWCRDSND